MLTDEQRNKFALDVAVKDGWELSGNPDKEFKSWYINSKKHTTALPFMLVKFYTSYNGLMKVRHDINFSELSDTFIDMKDTIEVHSDHKPFKEFPFGKEDTELDALLQAVHYALYGE